MSNFNLRSGNTTPFKMMGSSPAKTHKPGHKTSPPEPPKDKKLEKEIKQPQKKEKKKPVDPNINPKTGLYYPKPGGAEANVTSPQREGKPGVEAKKSGPPMLKSSPTKQKRKPITQDKPMKDDSPKARLVGVRTKKMADLKPLTKSLKVKPSAHEKHHGKMNKTLKTLTKKLSPKDTSIGPEHRTKKTKMVKGTTIFGKTIPEIKQMLKKANIAPPITRTVKKSGLRKDEKKVVSQNEQDIIDIKKRIRQGDLKIGTKDTSGSKGKEAIRKELLRLKLSRESDAKVKEQKQKLDTYHPSFTKD